MQSMEKSQLIVTGQANAPTPQSNYHPSVQS